MAIPKMQYNDLEMLAVVIARSQIVVADRSRSRPLPAGFDDIDLAILDWIAAEGRHTGRNFIQL